MTQRGALKELVFIPSQKKNMLVWCDYVCATGFAKVGQGIMKGLASSGKYNLDIVGINYDGMPVDPEQWPGRVFPAFVGLNQKYHDLFGRQHLVDRLVASEDYYDIIFFIQDTFNIEMGGFIDAVNQAISQKQKRPKVVFYFPIDATPKESWVRAVSKTDYPVAYTNYARNEVCKIDPSLWQKTKVIYHGHDFGGLYPIEEDMADFRKMYFGGHISNNAFLIINVNRNQTRKDIIRSFMILNELKKRGHQNIHLYMHMAQYDVGGDLVEMASNFDLMFGRDWSCPANFSPQTGIPQDILNKLYNSANCYLTTTHGEGFGLTLLEAGATKLPIVAPDNTCIRELYSDNKAFLVPAGETSSAWIMKENDNERLRPLMNVREAANAIERIIKGDKPDIQKTYEWVRSLSWDNICKEWEFLFDSIEPIYSKQVSPSPMLNRAERRRIEREQRKSKNKLYA